MSGYIPELAVFKLCPITHYGNNIQINKLMITTLEYIKIENIFGRSREYFYTRMNFFPTRDDWFKLSRLEPCLTNIRFIDKYPHTHL